MITLINPQLLVQRSDFFTTGIVYMPIGLAYLVAVLSKNGYKCKVIDAFGEAPNNVSKEKNFFVRGLSIPQILKRVPISTEIIFVYANLVVSHLSLIKLIEELKYNFKNIPIAVVENAQAVTAYSLEAVKEEFFLKGADFIITSDPEERILKFLNYFFSSSKDKVLIDGIGYKYKESYFYKPAVEFIKDLDKLPFPAWEYFPLENYWKLKYSHGPFQTDKYLPLLTSRGCPYNCNFCVTPATNKNNWRARSPLNVVEEIEYFLNKFGVKEYHIEDLNPTVSQERILGISKTIIEHKLNIIWKISSGTKIETIKNMEIFKIMKEAGCNYISFSPETGSEKVLKNMNKVVDFNHIYRAVREMKKNNIFTQACFILGYPSETKKDRRLTEKLVLKLTKIGIDEIAIFINTPVPGSKIFNYFKGYKNYTYLTFSPFWRKDYLELFLFRIFLYGKFLFFKIIFSPLKVIRHISNLFKRKFETKMEMVFYRGLHTFYLVFLKKGEL